MNYTYILKCSDNTYYTGWTTNLVRRILTHNRGKGAKYTRARLPVFCVYYEIYDTKVEAMKREYQIKSLSRLEKEYLMNESPHYRDDIEKPTKHCRECIFSYIKPEEHCKRCPVRLEKEL